MEPSTHDDMDAFPFTPEGDIAAPPFTPTGGIAAPLTPSGDTATPPRLNAAEIQSSYTFTPANVNEFTVAETTLGHDSALNGKPTTELVNTTNTDAVLSDVFNATQDTDMDKAWIPSSNKPTGTFTNDAPDSYPNGYSTQQDIYHTIRDHVHSTLFQSADLTSTIDRHTVKSQTLKAIISSSTGTTLQNGTLNYDSSASFYNTHPVLFNFSMYENTTMDSVNASGNGTDLAEMTSMISLNYGLPMMIVISVLLLTLVVITAFGNFLVGLALYKFKNLRTVSNYLIGNLALSDFLLAITILPLSAVNEALGHWVFGRYMCYFWLCIDVLYCTASIWNLCMIAFDRFTATLYPLWYREKRSAKQAVIYICLVWSVAIGICIPPLLGWNDITQTYFYDETNHVYQCMLFNNATYVIYSASGSFFIPFFITTFLYMRIFMVLRRRMKSMRRVQKAQRRTQAARPLLEKRDDEPNKPTSPNTLDVKPTEIEMTTTQNSSSSPKTVHADTSRETSGHTDDSSKSQRSSESGCHSDDEHGGQNGETAGLLPKSADGSLAPTPPLVIYNSNHNHIAAQDNGTSKATVTDSNHQPEKVKVIVTVENCNGKSTANNEAIKNIKTTTMKANGKVDKAAKHHNNNISHFKLINIIKSPKPPRRVSQRQRRQDRETKATIRMAIIIAFFCGFWIGFFSTYLLRGIVGERFYIPRELDAIFFWLGYSNSAINPILYTIFNEDFRKAFQKVLGCYRRGRHPGGYSRTRN